jgi:exopolysaccharide biosynthesis protein
MKRVSAIFVVGVLVLIMARLYDWQVQRQKQLVDSLNNQSEELRRQLTAAQNDFDNFKKSDQVSINKKLIEDLASIKKIFTETIKVYESLVDLKGDKKQYGKVDSYFAQVLSQLGENNQASASATLKLLSEEIRKQIAIIPTPRPPSGQSVKTNTGDFVVNVISADLRTTKVVVDTASESDCGDNCPVMSLAAYTARSGAYAAINGPYFCPAAYPSCAGKKNSFDTLLMNKKKTYFNSSNNVYSTVPAAIFSTTSRFVSKSMEWGRDTGVDSVIAGQPLLVFNGQSQFSGDGDPKKSGKGSRPFIGGTDNMVYIGIVYNATVAEAATVIAGMGIKNAINLDSGGSTAMWNNGRYVAGPGRDLPFGIMLVKR